jgi:hypothetical protein
MTCETARRGEDDAIAVTETPCDPSDEILATDDLVAEDRPADREEFRQDYHLFSRL